LIFLKPTTLRLVTSNSSHLIIQVSNAGSVSPANPIPRRILLVEDNYLNRQMLEDYLVFCGYQVLSLAVGAGFFQALADFQPELILLDLKLPDINGYTLLEQMSCRQDCQNPPVIVVSAFAFKTDQQRALDLGAKRYFVKPVSLRDLRQAIEEELLK
jgi:CheY-like chemotaxis protein